MFSSVVVVVDLDRASGGDDGETTKARVVVVGPKSSTTRTRRWAAADLNRKVDIVQIFYPVLPLGWLRQQ